MLVTDSTLVGYTLINGTYRLQLALLVGSLYNVIMFPDVQDSSILNLTANQISFVKISRYYYIPISHALLVVSNWIQEAKNLRLNRAKQIFSFASTLLMVL